MAVLYSLPRSIRICSFWRWPSNTASGMTLYSMMATIAAKTNTISRADPRSLRLRLEGIPPAFRSNGQRLAVPGGGIFHFCRFRLKRNDMVAPFQSIALIRDEHLILIEKETAPN